MAIVSKKMKTHYAQVENELLPEKRVAVPVIVEEVEKLYQLKKDVRDDEIEKHGGIDYLRVSTAPSHPTTLVTIRLDSATTKKWNEIDENWDAVIKTALVLRRQREFSHC